MSVSRYVRLSVHPYIRSQKVFPISMKFGTQIEVGEIHIITYAIHF